MDLTTALPYINTALLIIGPLGLGEYLKKRAENLATREDIEDLTRKVEVIKAEISEGVWNRQKRWELKREVLLEAIKRIADLNEPFYGMRRQHIAASVSDDNLRKALDKWESSKAEFFETVYLAATVCEEETEKTIRNVAVTASKAAACLRDKQEVSEDIVVAYWDSMRAARAAIRKELGIDEGTEPSVWRRRLGVVFSPRRVLVLLALPDRREVLEEQPLRRKRALLRPRTTIRLRPTLPSGSDGEEMKGRQLGKKTRG
jgi:hypothetical protein